MYELHEHGRVLKPWARWLLLGVLMALMIIVGYAIGLTNGGTTSPGSELVGQQKSTEAKEQTPAPSTEKSVPDGYTPYTIDEIGLSFAYPDTYGVASSRIKKDYTLGTKDSGPGTDNTGKYLEVTFSEKKEFVVGIPTSDFSRGDEPTVEEWGDLVALSAGGTCAIEKTIDSTYVYKFPCTRLTTQDGRTARILHGTFEKDGLEYGLYGERSEFGFVDLPANDEQYQQAIFGMRKADDTDLASLKTILQTIRIN